MFGLLVAVRPMYLGGGLLLFVIGLATADGPMRIVPAALGLFVVALVHVITHYVNDAEDVATDNLSAPTGLTGGSRAIQRGLVTAKTLFRVSAGLAVVVCVIAMIEVALGEFVAASLHLAILLFGYAYSGRPFMLGRRGLSEFDAALVMGFLVPLAGADAGGNINAAAWATSGVLFVETIFARLCTAYPDLDADRATDKRTLPAMVGRRGTIVVFVVVGIVIAVAGFFAAPWLPLPSWQYARAWVVAAFAMLCALAIATRFADEHRVALPVLGVLGYACSQGGLLAAALVR